MFRMNNFGLLVILIIVLFIAIVRIECRPRTQKILVDGHEWTVPNEPGWEEGESKILKFFSHSNFDL